MYNKNRFEPVDSVWDVDTEDQMEEMKPYNLIYHLFREIRNLEWEVIRLRQEVNRTSPEPNLRKKPYQDIFSDLSFWWTDEPGYKRYVELFHEDPYDGEWGSFPDGWDNEEEMFLGKQK